MTWEQRKTFRFSPRKHIFASLGGNLSQVGKIVDISLCGLAEFLEQNTSVQRKGGTGR